MFFHCVHVYKCMCVYLHFINSMEHYPALKKGDCGVEDVVQVAKDSLSWWGPGFNPQCHMCTPTHGDVTICRSTEEHYAKWNKPDAERKLLHDLIYMCSVIWKEGMEMELSWTQHTRALGSIPGTSKQSKTKKPQIHRGDFHIFDEAASIFSQFLINVTVYKCDFFNLVAHGWTVRLFSVVTPRQLWIRGSALGPSHPTSAQGTGLCSR